ncbi:MAG: hypothetical protein ACT443_13885 [Gemmatimonadota bacterium]
MLKKLAPDCSLDMLRNAGRIRALSLLRRELIAVLLIEGYRGSAIARCLYVSQALVSDVARQIRGRIRAA